MEPLVHWMFAKLGLMCPLVHCASLLTDPIVCDVWDWTLKPLQRARAKTLQSCTDGQIDLQAKQFGFMFYEGAVPRAHVDELWWILVPGVLALALPSHSFRMLGGQSHVPSGFPASWMFPLPRIARCWYWNTVQDDQGLFSWKSSFQQETESWPLPRWISSFHGCSERKRNLITVFAQEWKKAAATVSFE